MRQPAGEVEWPHFFLEQAMDKARAVKWAKSGGVWLATILLATIFVPQGYAKFSDGSGWARAFRHWEYPTWFRIAIGVIELGGVALLFWPRFARWGAAAILAVMLGAWFTHLTKDHGQHMTSEVVPITLSLLVLWLRRPTAGP
jgi:putative oxidoreductase